MWRLKCSVEQIIAMINMGSLIWHNAVAISLELYIYIYILQRGRKRERERI